MAKTYSRNDILEKCKVALNEPQFFYQQEFINYSGVCSDTKEPYTEVIAEFLCDNKNFVIYEKGIKTIKRNSSYHTATHDGVYRDDSVRKEEIIAMKLFNESKNGHQYAHIGRILDYQVPLRSKHDDKAGKIDLLAYDGTTLYLLELKKLDTPETMLRCVLEGYTYLKTVDTQKLIQDFNDDIAGLNIPKDAPVKASPLVFVGSLPYREYVSRDRVYLKNLMKRLDSEPFFVDQIGDEFIILK